MPSRLEARLLNSVLSVSFCAESPFLSFSTLASQSRPPSLSWQNHLLIRVDRRFDVQAASPTAPKRQPLLLPKMQTRRAGRFSVSPGRSNTVLLRSLASKTRARLESDRFPTLNPFYFQFLFRSLASTHKHASLSEADKLLPLVSLSLFGHTLSADWAGPRPGWGRKKRELSFHHHRTNNKTASYTSRHTCNVHFTNQPS